MLVVFSDLDGTLLDHDTYSWEPAVPALDALRSVGAALILVSSKTLAEMRGYRDSLNLREPVVAENGAVIDVPAGYFGPNVTPLSVEAPDRCALQTIYLEAKQSLGLRCEAFFELGIEGIVRETGLSPDAAEHANNRQASEPIRWYDSDQQKERFVAHIHDHGLRCVMGGRFLHLMPNTGKGDAVRHIIDALRQQSAGADLTSVSLGDGPNDLDMLAATDIAVIVPGQHRHPMPLESDGRIIRAQSAGPSGWNTAILDILEERQDNR